MLTSNFCTYIQEYGKVVGVSKHCWPACYRFLELLATQPRPGDKTKQNLEETKDIIIEYFRVRGRHIHVSGCSLPLWTPSHIVDDMNAIFGAILRMALADLMPDTAFKPRVASGGSQAISVDSGREKKETDDTQSFTSFRDDN